MLINIIAQQEQDRINGLAVEPDQRVSSLCREIARRLNIENAERIRLIYCGRLLRNDSHISEYNITDGSSVHMVIRPIEASTSAAEQPPNQSSNADGIHTFSFQTNVGGLPSALLGIVNSVMAPHPQNPGIGDTGTFATNLSQFRPLIDTVINAISNPTSNPTNYGSSNVQRGDVPSPPQPPAPETRLRTPVSTNGLSEATSPAQAHTNTTTTAPAAVPIAGVHLHIHCNLADVDLLPERLSRVMQQLNRGSESHTSGIPIIDIQVSPSAHPQPRPQEAEAQSPAPDEVPSFLITGLYQFMEGLLSDLPLILIGAFTFAAERCEDIPQKLNEHLTQYYPGTSSSETNRENQRFRLQSMSDFEGEQLVSRMMRMKSMQEMLTELAATDAQRERITLELKNAFKYYIYRLLKEIQSVEAVGAEQCSRIANELVLIPIFLIRYRAQNLWFRGNAEPSVVEQKINNAVLEMLSSSFEGIFNVEASTSLRELTSELLLNLSDYIRLLPDNFPNEMFTQWQDFIAKEEENTASDSDALVLEALNEQEERERPPLAQLEHALDEWEKFGGSAAETAQRVQGYLKLLRMRQGRSNIFSDNNADPRPKPEVSSPFFSEYLAEHQ